jgi:hypothetical protein
LYHCHKELCNKEKKWIRRNFETTPERSRLGIPVEDDEDANKRPDGNKIVKERKKRGAFSGTCKEECRGFVTTDVLIGRQSGEAITTRR